MKEPVHKEMSLPFISQKSEDVRVSFEFFPPKTKDMEDTLWQSLKLLAPCKPEFVSVTYGAGGTTQETTHNVVKAIKKETSLNVAAHLTCIKATKDEIRKITDQYWEEGIKHIVALRGDIPEGYINDKDHYQHANELVKDLKSLHNFEITVAGYPEKHPEASTIEEDLDNLKRKIDAGANRIISQFFMDPALFLNFYDKARAKGITVPIIPGILPVSNFEKTRDFAKLCGASMPDWMTDLFAGLDQQPQTRSLIAAALAIEQCRVLYNNGIRDFHFYTLNRADLVLAICHTLGKRKQ